MRDHDEDQDLIDRLKALPREGNEPDWLDLSRRINAAVGPTVPPVPWYRGSAWRWMIPLLVGAAAVLAVRIATHHPREASVAPIAHREPTRNPPPAEAPSGDEIALYLDGEAIVVDEGANALLDDMFADDDEPADSGLLSTDDSWVDDLDPAALGAVDQWLDAEQHERKKG